MHVSIVWHTAVVTATSLSSLATLIDGRVSSRVLQDFPETQEYYSSTIYDFLTNLY